MREYQILSGGDASLFVEFAPVINEAVNARCLAVARAIRARQINGIRDVVPAFHTVAIHFDPTLVDRNILTVLLHECASVTAKTEPGDHRLIEVPVSYGGEFGPDLASIAALARCSEEDAVAMHAEPVYRVYMLGFLPGFAYMGQVDPRIAAARLDTPRVRVPAGSVAIAGLQTGIYPQDSPGGWRIIGHTTLRLYAPEDHEPFRFKPGDRVKFVPSNKSTAVTV